MDGPVELQVLEEQRFTPDQAASALHRAVGIGHERVRERAADMSLAELIELGREIGIDADDVRQAAALERFGGRRDRASWLVRVAGPEVAAGERIVAAPASAAAALLDDWARVGHCMSERERGPGRVRWEPAGGILGSVRRGIRAVVGEPVPEGISAMTTFVAPLDRNRSVVRVEIEPGPRGSTVATAAVASGLIAAGGLAAALAWTPIALLALPLAAVVGGAVMVARRRRANEAERAIARLMSGLENREGPTSTMSAVRELGVTLRDRAVRGAADRSSRSSGAGS